METPGGPSRPRAEQRAWSVSLLPTPTIIGPSDVRDHSTCSIKTAVEAALASGLGGTEGRSGGSHVNCKAEIIPSDSENAPRAQAARATAWPRATAGLRRSLSRFQ